MVEDARAELNGACINLLIAIGMISSVMWRYPSDVQEHFVDKIKTLTGDLLTQTEEFVGFGEAYDDHVGD